MALARNFAEAGGFIAPAGYRRHRPPADVYRDFGFDGAEDLGNMFQFKRDFNEDFCAARDVLLSRKLNPALQSFDAWLERNKAAIPP